MIEDRDVLVGGSTLPINRNLSGKIYMVTHTLNDAGGVPLSLIDENFKVIKRTHFLRTYPNPPYEFNIYDHTSFLEYEGPSSYIFVYTLKSASNLNGNLNCSKELEHYAS